MEVQDFFSVCKIHHAAWNKLIAEMLNSQICDLSCLYLITLSGLDMMIYETHSELNLMMLSGPASLRSLVSCMQSELNDTQPSKENYQFHNEKEQLPIAIKL